MENAIKLGVSSCLLGQSVRYDGGHKHDRYLTDILGRFVEFVPVCPEYEAGFGIPREAMRLTGDPASPRLVTRTGGVDLTEAMTAWIGPRLRDLETSDLCGFIFKSGSPSSGMERVKVYDAKGGSRKNGVGLFAGAFMERFPLMPVEEEGRLNDIDIRENFIVRLFAYRRWKDLAAADRRPSAIMDFHARHKYLLMAHNPAILKQMGALVAGVRGRADEEFRAEYERLFLTALRYQATVKKNTNVLQHMAGYFKTRIGPGEKAELAEVIDQYFRGLIPLIVPVTLVRHYVRIHGEEYLASQHYLDPHPLELKLRNHA